MDLSDNCKMLDCEGELNDQYQINESEHRKIIILKFQNYFCQVYRQMKIAKVDTTAKIIRKPSNQNKISKK